MITRAPAELVDRLARPPTQWDDTGDAPASRARVYLARGAVWAGAKEAWPCLDVLTRIAIG